MRSPVIVPPCEEEQIRELNRLLQLGAPALVGADGERIDVPESVYKILKDVVRDMQAGRAVALVPENQQLTTQRAADMLGVSRPHLIKLLDNGVLGFHMVGAHRRIYLADVIAYSKKRDEERNAALTKLAKEALGAGLYDNTGIPEGGRED